MLNFALDFTLDFTLVIQVFRVQNNSRLSLWRRDFSEYYSEKSLLHIITHVLEL